MNDIGIGNLLGKATLALIGKKPEFAVKIYERYYLDFPDSAIFKMFICLIKAVKNVSASLGLKL